MINKKVDSLYMTQFTYMFDHSFNKRKNNSLTSSSTSQIVFFIESCESKYSSLSAFSLLLKFNPSHSALGLKYKAFFDSKDFAPNLELSPPYKRTSLPLTYIGFLQHLIEVIV